MLRRSLRSPTSCSTPTGSTALLVVKPAGPGVVRVREQGRWSRELSQGFSLLDLAWGDALASLIGGTSRGNRQRDTRWCAQRHRSRRREPVVANPAKRTQRERQKDHTEAEMGQRE